MQNCVLGFDSGQLLLINAGGEIALYFPKFNREIFEIAAVFMKRPTLAYHALYFAMYITFASCLWCYIQNVCIRLLLLFVFRRLVEGNEVENQKLLKVIRCCFSVTASVRLHDCSPLRERQPTENKHIDSPEYTIGNVLDWLTLNYGRWLFIK